MDSASATELSQREEKVSERHRMVHSFYDFIILYDHVLVGYFLIYFWRKLEFCPVFVSLV